MNCRTCNYSLWNLPARNCPECGTAFKPSDYEFRQSAVRYCCPHCRQAYYGTGLKGHLVPRSFVCVGCGQPVDMDEMIILPTEGIDERATQPNAVNWPERHNCGFWKAYFVTLGRSMGAPSRAIDAAPASSSLSSAWWFSMLTDLLVLIFGYGVFGLFFLAIGVFAPGGGGGGGPFFPMLGCIGMGVAFGLGTSQIWSLLHGLTTHMVLAVSGPTEHGLGRTMQATWYSAGPRIVSAVPCVSQYLWFVGMVWSTVSLILMLPRAQNVGTGRAVLAALVLPTIVVVGGSGLIIWAITAGSAPGGPWSMPTPAPPVISGPSGAAASGFDAQKMQTVLDVVTTKMRSGGLRHAADLVAEREIQVYDLIFPSGTTQSPSSTRFGTVTLDQLPMRRPSERAQIIADVVASMPEGTAEYKLGGMHFTHLGVDIAKANPNVWLLISEPIGAWPGGAPGQSWVRVVGKVDGTIEVLTLGAFPAKLSEQNTLRGDGGLPLLPVSAFPAPAPSATPPIPPSEED